MNFIAYSSRLLKEVQVAAGVYELGEVVLLDSDGICRKVGDVISPVDIAGYFAARVDTSTNDGAVYIAEGLVCITNDSLNPVTLADLPNVASPSPLYLSGSGESQVISKTSSAGAWQLKARPVDLCNGGVMVTIYAGPR